MPSGRIATTRPPPRASAAAAGGAAVATRHDGTTNEQGDYSNAVVVYAADDGVELWRKSRWEGKGPPFTWGLAFSGDSGTFAIGHWDSFACVERRSIVAARMRMRAAFDPPPFVLGSPTAAC